TTPGNTGCAGNGYRTDDVDIEASTDTGGGWDICSTAVGEWLNYTVNVGTAGTYTASIRVAQAFTGGTFHLTLDGTTIGGELTVLNTGGWQTWSTLNETVSLPAGTHVLRLAGDTIGTYNVGNFDWLQFTSGSYAYSQSSYYA